MTNIPQSVKKLVSKGLINKQGSHYSIMDGLANWEKQAPFYYDDDLETYEKIMLGVFSEESPSLDLPKEDRMYANILGKENFYSDDLREGLAKTLAYIGNYPSKMTNCTLTKCQNFPDKIIIKIFQKITWKNFATISNILPFFAEAAPDTFLSKIQILADERILFKQLQQEEGDIFSHGNYLQGLINALEILCWSHIYFARVIHILTILSEIINDDNVICPPQRALKEIFNPFYLLTLATPCQIDASLNLLSYNNPQLCWDILSFEFDSHLFSLHSLPKIIKILPEDFSNKTIKNPKIYLENILIYEKILLKIAEQRQDFIPKLANIFFKFKHQQSINNALKIFRSLNTNSQDDYKEQVWCNLYKIYLFYKRNKSKNQTMKISATLKEIEEILKLIAPESFIYREKYLFSSHALDLLNNGNSKYEDSLQQLAQKQDKALKKIFNKNNFTDLFRFQKIVEDSYSLGCCCGRNEIILENSTIYSFMNRTNNSDHNFVYGYLKTKYVKSPTQLIEKIHHEKWPDSIKAKILCHLPFEANVWTFAQKWLGQNESLYWQSCPVFSFYPGKEIGIAISKFIQYSCFGNAIQLFCQCLDKNIPFNFDDCALALMNISPEDVKKISRYRLTALIQYLQKNIRTSKQKEKVQTIEFIYLELLDHKEDKNTSPLILNYNLANNPIFFIEALILIQESQDKDYVSKINFLLNQLNIVPGTDSLKHFSYKRFITWYTKVIGLCKNAKMKNMALYFIAQTLVYAAPDKKNNLIVSKQLAAFLNAQEQTELREKYEMAILNSQGMEWVDFTGEKDTKTAQTYHKIAGDLENHGFIRLATNYRNIAKFYEQESLRHIEEGKLRNQHTNDG